MEAMEVDWLGRSLVVIHEPKNKRGRYGKNGGLAKSTLKGGVK